MTFTESQQQYLKYAQTQLVDLLDELTSAPEIVTDEMLDNDDLDAINAAKKAAIRYMMQQLVG